MDIKYVIRSPNLTQTKKSNPYRSGSEMYKILYASKKHIRTQSVISQTQTDNPKKPENIRKPIRMSKLITNKNI